MSADRGKVNLHFISNTHWDREWRYSMQRTRHMLVEMLDMLFDIFEKEPEFKSFHMDSQSIPLTDYLEIRPEMEERVRKYVQEGRFLVGPWFCLPDEYLVGGESLIRNLLLGHKIAKKFGPVSKTGYSPFSWGQISQMPQIYRGFGIDMISFYRGANTLVAPKSEFIWEGPDGTRICASRLARRPRYNVWYILQRPAYWNESDVDNRHLDWNAGLGQFKFVTEGMELLDYQYIHPTFDYNAETIPRRVRQALEEQDNDWTQPNRFWSAGHDTSTPDIREVRMIADIQKALGEDGEAFHSTVKEWQDAVIRSAGDWPVVTGEMRHTGTEGSSSDLIGWVTSSRTRIKQANFAAERDVTFKAEPLAVFASLLGAEYPQGFLDLSYNWLLQNHGHDSIAGCGRDILEDDVMNRLSQSREISGCVAGRALMDIASAVDFRPLNAEMALLVYNPAPFARTEVAEVILEIPDCWNCKAFDIFDEDGNRIAVQVTDKSPGTKVMAQSPNDVANFQLTAQYRASVEFTGVPGMGYRCFKVVPVVKPKLKNPVSMVTGPQRMANEYLEVTVNANGTYDVLDKDTGRLFKGLGYFRDSSEIGTSWVHTPVAGERVYTTLNECAEVALTRDGELEASFTARISWRLPEGADDGETARSAHFKPYTIENTLTLRKGARWLDVVTRLDNNCECHYLQAGFPTGVTAENACAQGQFDVLERPVKRPDYSLYKEIPMTEAPMNSFVDLSDGEAGFCLLNEGLKAYEAADDLDRTLYLSLLRCYPLRMCVTEYDLTDYSRTDKGSQCPGPHAFHYAVMPHRGDWRSAGLWQASERFVLPFQAAETAPTAIGHMPLSMSFLEFSEDGLHVSAVKRAEDGDGWVVRLFNPFDGTFRCKARLNGGFTGPKTRYSPVERLKARGALPEDRGEPWTSAEEVTLEELPVRSLEMDAEGWIDVELGKKKIMTVKIK